MPSPRFQVHEYQRLVIGQPCRTIDGPDAAFEERHFDAIARYVDRSGSAAFRIGHRSLTVGHHVGFLKIGATRIEILPKLSASLEGDYRALLLHMLREVAGVRVTAQSPSPLLRRPGDLYELLVERFVLLVEELLRQGLVRSYRSVEENTSRLQGRLLVGRQVCENVVHKERLCVAYDVFDADHVVNRVLWHALERVRRDHVDDGLVRRADAALGAFPEVTPTPLMRADIDAIRLDRRTVRYREAIDLARMILLDERPDLRWGDGQVIALLFDMNALFEAYIDAQLRCIPGVRVKSQAQKVFWSAPGGGRVARPDILVWTPGAEQPVVLDTKWKVLRDGRPSDDDLRQLFAYLHLWKAQRGILVYPRAASEHLAVDGAFQDSDRRAGTAYVNLFRGLQPNADEVRSQLGAMLGVATAGTTAVTA